MPVTRAPISRASQMALLLPQAGLDMGPMLLRRPCPIGFAEIAGELHNRLARLAAKVLAEALLAGERGVPCWPSACTSCWLIFISSSQRAPTHTPGC